VQPIRLKFLDRAGQRAQCGHVRAHAVAIEAANPRILSDQPGRAGRRRIEVVLEIQVRAAKIVHAGH
jgi:hypothetical protein